MEEKKKKPRTRDVLAQDARPARTRIRVNHEALKRLKLVVVAYSRVCREWFPNEGAYEAELEVEERGQEVVAELEKLGVPAKACAADQYFLTTLLVDRPDLVLNLVDTVRGRDYLQTSVPAALELAEIPYTGAGMQGMVIGNDRNLIKQLLDTHDIPTPPYQFVSRRSARLSDDLGLPLIVKLNESGGSVGIDNRAVKESVEEAAAQVQHLLSEYKAPVIVERFISGPEVTVVAFDDGSKLHVLQAQKIFHHKPDGKHDFTSLESYQVKDSYTYKKVDRELADKIEPMAREAFNALHFRDYAKFDVRVDEETGIPYFTDCNPNTAFGPNIGLPFTEVLALHRIRFSTVLASLMSKYARRPGPR